MKRGVFCLLHLKVTDVSTLFLFWLVTKRILKDNTNLIDDPFFNQIICHSSSYHCFFCAENNFEHLIPDYRLAQVGMFIFFVRHRLIFNKDTILKQIKFHLRLRDVNISTYDIWPIYFVARRDD